MHENNHDQIQHPCRTLRLQEKIEEFLLKNLKLQEMIFFIQSIFKLEVYHKVNLNNQPNIL